MSEMTERLTVELTNTTNVLLQEIASPEMKRKDVAMTYALAMRSSCKTDWSKVNHAIIDRWSRSALEWIKKQAHSGKCFDG